MLEQRKGKVMVELKSTKKIVSSFDISPKVTPEDITVPFAEFKVSL